MHQQKYTLTWHTYSDHLRDILKELNSDDSFTDVTLVTDDKKQIKAHRNILSACSSVFKEILQTNKNNNHPLIYLRGIEHFEMESILQYIYLGEAKFYEERMSEFFTVAKNLDIRELTKGIEDGDFEDAQEDTNITTEESPIEADNMEEPKKEKYEAAEGQFKTNSKPVTKGTKNECQQCYKVFHDTSTLRRHIKSIHEGVKYACNQCHYQFTQQTALTKHIQCKHEGVKYACSQCDYQAKHQGYLKTHIQSRHEGVKYACNQCDNQYTAQQSLTIHIQSKHEGIRYACNHCDQQYMDQRSHIRHMKSAHMIFQSEIKGF